MLYDSDETKSQIYEPFFLCKSMLRKRKGRSLMEVYSGFAKVYDDFMDNVDYENWTSYLVERMKEHGITEGILLDLGCGTGKMTRKLAKYGFDMIGIDNSFEMLDIAREASKEEEEILYLLQDMREFELYGTVCAITSNCDSINYILEYEDLVQVFQLVNNYLDPGGIFIFDVNTEYKYREILSDNTIAEDREEISFIWDNYYYEEEKMNEYALNLFVKEENGLYRKLQETHYQRAYSIEELSEAIEEAGMELISIYDAFTKDAPKEDSERLHFIVREKGKQEML